MTEERRKVILDYAQELQHNDKPWREFEFKYRRDEWERCNNVCNPFTRLESQYHSFRRRPATITVTMPVPKDAGMWHGLSRTIALTFDSIESCETALAAIRAEREKANG